MKRTVIFVVFLSVVFALGAQVVPNFSPNFNPNFQLGGLLHPDKVKMNHTMSFMTGVSSSGHGYYQSSYTNHLQFMLRENLRMNVDMSVVNLGTMTHNNDMRFNSNNDNQNVIVPAFSLEFRPTQNSVIYFEYRQGHPHHHWNDRHRFDQWHRH